LLYVNNSNLPPILYLLRDMAGGEKVWPQETRNIPVSWCKAYLKLFRHDSGVWQTDGQTDSLVAYATLHYVVWPKTRLCFLNFDASQ